MTHIGVITPDENEFNKVRKKHSRFNAMDRKKYLREIEEIKGEPHEYWPTFESVKCTQITERSQLFEKAFSYEDGSDIEGEYFFSFFEFPNNNGFPNHPELTFDAQILSNLLSSIEVNTYLGIMENLIFSQKIIVFEKLKGINGDKLYNFWVSECKQNADTLYKICTLVPQSLLFEAIMEEDKYIYREVLPTEYDNSLLSSEYVKTLLYSLPDPTKYKGDEFSIHTFANDKIPTSTTPEVVNIKFTKTENNPVSWQLCSIIGWSKVDPASIIRIKGTFEEMEKLYWKSQLRDLYIDLIATGKESVIETTESLCKKDYKLIFDVFIELGYRSTNRFIDIMAAFQKRRFRKDQITDLVPSRIGWKDHLSLDYVGISLEEKRIRKMKEIDELLLDLE